MTHPVTAQLALEANLHDQCTRIARLLETPLSDDRSRAIHEIWQGIARSFGPYQKGHAGIHPTKVDPDAPRDTQMQMDARLDFMRHGARRASLWDEVALLLRRQAQPVQTALLDTHQIGAVTRQDDLLSYLTFVMHHLANPIADDRAHTRQNQFPDISLSGGHFINLMQATYRISLAKGNAGPFKFLDVGCGGGTKVVMASHFFEQTDGLEYNVDFLAHAQRTISVAKVECCSVFEGDALTFTDYGAYDIIYFFRPISDETMLTEMETKILDQVAPGTVLIAPMEFTLTKANAHRVAPIAGGIYLAHTSHDAGAEIKSKAERIGPDWRLLDENAKKALGFWYPVIDASRRNGFCLPR